MKVVFAIFLTAGSLAMTAAFASAVNTQIVAASAPAFGLG